MDPEPVASADESARTWSGASGVPRAGRAGGDEGERRGYQQARDQPA
ncbi:hypothetical protein HMPREF9062_1913 [Actinomyces sp. oral taxon 448 str. F0400]|nr:hypothetical protein HMPREF9062_1913 [Actinomyces sp. oral taxon 448 str. F0400]